MVQHNIFFYTSRVGFQLSEKNKIFIYIIVYVLSITLYESGNVTLVGDGFQLSWEMDFNSRPELLYHSRCGPDIISLF